MSFLFSCVCVNYGVEIESVVEMPRLWVCKACVKKNRLFELGVE